MAFDMKILMATAEVAPFSKVGGLGDVCGTLPKIISDSSDIRIITPLYGKIDRDKFLIRKMIGLDNVEIKVGDNSYQASYFRTNIPDTRIQVFFVYNEALFDRPGIYADPDNNEGYKDNPTRFLFFSKAVIEFLKMGVFSPDVIHLNDNQTAPIAPMLSTVKDNKKLNNIPTLLTIHNMEYQGRYPLHYVYEAGLDQKLAKIGQPLEFYGDFNFLKSGIIYSDKVNTVSERYAKETTESPEFGFGLEGVLLDKGKDYSGILNGVDYSIWNPETDSHIPKNYDANNLFDKTASKKALIDLCGFPNRNYSWPVIGIVSRLAWQKGIDIILDALPQMMNNELYLIILGTGNKELEQRLEQAHMTYPDKLALMNSYDEKVAHLIEAGSNMFLMPSRFEPCGLNQLYSLKYGTLPIVRETGGLADTIKDYSPDSGEGWGFTFSGYDPNDLVNAIERALQAYQDQELWTMLARRAMRLDFSWKSSGAKYLKLYRTLCDGSSKHS